MERENSKVEEWIAMNVNKNQFSTSSLPLEKIHPSFRILSNEELNFFSPEAYGYLIQLQSLNLVNALQVENIIDRCFLMGFNHIELEDIKTVVSHILLGKETEHISSHTIYHPGNDKVN